MTEITECPRRLVGQDGAMVLFAADQAEKGVWPVGGGWMEQTASVVEAVRLAQVLEAEHETERIERELRHG